MKLSKKNKKYIQNNYKSKSNAELAKELGVSESAISQYLKKKKLKREQKKAVFNRVVLKNWADIKNFLIESRGIFAILAVVTVLVYFNSLWGEFVSDDLRAYVNNATVQDMTLALETGKVPIVILAIFYQLFGENPIPLHVYSLVLHVLSVFAAFIFTSMAFNKRIGVIAALLFAVHPVNVEAVSWISGRKYLIIGLVSFLSMAFYIMYRDSQKYIYLGISIAIYLITLTVFKYPWLLVLPFLVLITDQLFIERKINIKSAIYSIPYFVTAGVIALLVFSALFTQRVTTLETKYNIETVNTANYFLRVPYTLFMSAKLLVFPKDLTIYHEGEYISEMFFGFMVLTAIALFVAIIYFWRKNKQISGLFMFMLIGIAPTLSPVQVSWFIAERYMYLTALAFCILLAIIFIKLEDKTKIKNLTVYLLVTFLVLYSVRSVVRNVDWQSRKNLWEATARVSPNSARVYNNLGDVYGGEGNYQRAIQAFEAALTVNPNYSEAMHNLGNTYIQINELDLAEEAFTKSLEMNPALFQSYYKLGVVAYGKGDYNAAKSYFEKAIEMNPNYAPPYEGLRILEAQNKVEVQQ